MVEPLNPGTWGTFILFHPSKGRELLTEGKTSIPNP